MDRRREPSDGDSVAARARTQPPLVVDGLRKRFAGSARLAVDGVSFEIGKAEFFTLLGPSGCGKTTTLRIVAGLEDAEGGVVTVGGRVVYSRAHGVTVPPHRRGLAMVHQSYAVWPHMTVLANVSLPLRMARPRIPKGEIPARSREALRRVELAELAEELPGRLSGGQQQRLALARALVAEPRLLLLDEPLSNLDVRLRDSMREALARIQREAGVATLYVTHDQDEALALSQRVAVMCDGRIAQIGTPREIYDAPASPFVAGFVGRTNFVEGSVVDVVGDGVVVETGIGRVVVTDSPSRSSSKVVLAVRPEGLVIRDDPALPDRPNAFRAVVRDVVYFGKESEVGLQIGERTLIARSHPRRSPEPGSSVCVEVVRERCRLL